MKRIHSRMYYHLAFNLLAQVVQTLLGIWMPFGPVLIALSLSTIMASLYNLQKAPSVWNGVELALSVVAFLLSPQHGGAAFVANLIVCVMMAIDVKMAR